jgi:hypothetical protein
MNVGVIPTTCSSGNVAFLILTFLRFAGGLEIQQPQDAPAAMFGVPV